MLRATLGQHELDDLRANQAGIKELLKEIIDSATEPWGVSPTSAASSRGRQADEQQRRVQ